MEFLGVRRVGSYLRTVINIAGEMRGQQAYTVRHHTIFILKYAERSRHEWRRERDNRLTKRLSLNDEDEVSSSNGVRFCCCFLDFNSCECFPRVKIELVPFFATPLLFNCTFGM